MNKTKAKDTAKIISFILIFLILLESVSLTIFSNKAAAGFKNKLQDAYSFVGESDNSIQVVGLGNSDLYSGFSPYDLWNGFGYTSTVCASVRQSIQQSELLLKKVLQNQSPNLVIVETDMLYDTNPKKVNKSKSSDKLSDIINGLNPDYFDNDIKNIFTVFQFHNKWKNKTPSKICSFTTHGYRYNNKVCKLKKVNYMNPTTQKEQISQTNINQMNQIISLCRTNNIDILFVEMPSVTSWNYQRHNAVSEYAKQNNIDFIDFNILYNDADISPLNCFRDRGNHLNYQATQKVTAYIGNYIMQKYNLKQVSDSKIADSWNKNYIQFKKEQNTKSSAPFDCR